MSVTANTLGFDSLAADVQEALFGTYDLLTLLASNEDYYALLSEAFGSAYDMAVAETIRQQWESADFSDMPKIEILSSAELQEANGAYAASTDTIYLSDKFLTTNSNDISAIRSVLLEEVGHYLDAKINTVDTVGDEGAIFAARVEGTKLGIQELSTLKSENDSALVSIGGVEFPIEQNTSFTLSELVKEPNTFQGLDSFLRGLDSSLSSVDGLLQGIDLPIIGMYLTNSSNFIENFRGTLVRTLENSFLANDSLEVIKNNIVDSLGNNGLDILLESDIFFVDSNYKATNNLNDAQGIQFELNLGQDLIQENLSELDINLGLDTLLVSLETIGEVNFGLDWGLDLCFGFHVVDGFYVDTTQADEISLSFEADLENFSATGDLFLLSLNAVDNNSQLVGNLSLDLLDPYDTDKRIYTDQIFSDSGKVTEVIFDNPSLDADAKLDIRLQLSLGEVDLLPKFQTDLVAGLEFEWTPTGLTSDIDSLSFNNISVNVGSLVSNVLDPIQESLDPFLEVLEPIGKVFDERIPILSDFLGRNITLGNIDSLLGSIGNINLPIVDLLNPYQPLFDSIIQLTSLSESLSEGIVKDESGNILLNIGSVSVAGNSLRSTNVTGDDVIKPSYSSPQLSSAIENLVKDGFGDSYFTFPILTDPTQLINLLFGQDADLFRFDSPRLFGDLQLDLELDTNQILDTIRDEVNSNLPGWVKDFGLNGEFVVNQVLKPILPEIQLAFGTDLRFDAQLGLGYDTRGIFNSIQSKDPLDLLDGFYLDDTRDSVFPMISQNPLEYGNSNYFDNGQFLLPPSASERNVDVPELYFKGSQFFSGSISKPIDLPLILADVEGSIGLALNGSGSIEGSLDFNEALDLDSDGKLRLYELGTGRITDVIKPCLHFDLAANAILNIGVKISYENVVTKTIKKLWEFITRKEIKLESKPFRQPIILFDGSINLDIFDCDQNLESEDSVQPVLEPVLASLQGDGSLLLHIGDFAEFRRAGNISDGDEVFIVDSISGDAGNEVIAITFGDITQQFEGQFTSIVGFAGVGDDKIIFRNVKTQGYLEGGEGNDFIEILSDGDGIESSVIYGGAGNDSLRGGSGSDFIDGGSGNDTIEGFSGDDELSGDSGNDVIVGGEGDDQMLGGSGNDSLVGGSASNINDGNDNIFGEAGDDVIVGGNAQFDENGTVALISGTGSDLLLGGDGEDTIYGQDGNNLISGEGGNDSLIGGQNDDTIIGGSFDSAKFQSDDDFIDGQSGNDILFGDNVDFNDSNQLVATNGAGNDTIYGSQGIEVIDGQGGFDHIYSGSENDTILGSLGDDTLDGQEGNDFIQGGEGNDVIDGGNNDDTLFGNQGSDIIQGDSGNDLIEGNEGDDYIEGGVDNDTIAGGLGNDTIAGGGDDDLIEGDEGDDLIHGDEGDDAIYGNDDNDTLFGDEGNDLIEGNDGDDSIFGGDNNDTLFGNQGNDNIEGNLGTDYIEGNGGNDSISGGHDNDSITGGLGDDTISGDAGGDLIYGDEGNDSIYGGTENDSISGGLGNDTITGNAGTDLIYGDSGTDLIAGNEGDDAISGGADNDTITGDIGNDLIYGDAGDDLISGELDNDSISGGLDNDSIAGDAGDDLIHGDAGDDTIAGGTGNDMISGDAGDDVIQGETGNDTLFGGLGVDTIIGGEGEDQILGEADNDWLEGNDGNDSLAGGDGEDTLYGGTGDDFLNGQMGNDLIFGDVGNDILYGEEGEDSLYGGDDDDYLVGGAGADILDGGAGSDFISYHTSKEGVQIMLQASRVIGGDAEGDQIFNIENIEGSYQDDYLVADNGENILSGLGGNDFLDGKVGDDQLFGGDGDDVLEGREGNDSLQGDAGNDTLDGGSGDDMLGGGKGNDQLLGGRSGNDTLSGGEGNDYINASAGNDLVFGDAGDDWIEAGAQDDFVFGGDGNDTLNGLSGHDTLLGGSGDDLIYAHADDNLLYGGAGNDTLYGGNGKGVDTFFLNRLDAGTDTIYNFQFGEDYIALLEGVSRDALTISYSPTAQTPSSGNSKNKAAVTQDIAISYNGNQLALLQGVTIGSDQTLDDYFISMDVPNVPTNPLEAITNPSSALPEGVEGSDFFPGNLEPQEIPGIALVPLV